MLRTPEHLQKEFGIPADAGHGRAISRVILAYAGTHKKQFLGTIMPMVMAGALPEYGQKLRQYNEVTQDEMAKMAGLGSRSTFTRRVSLFTRMDPDLQPKQSRRRDGTTGDVKKRRKGTTAQLLDRHRNFARANRYSLLMPTGRDESRPDRWLPPSLRDLKEDAGTSALFDEGAYGFKSWKGFKDIPLWVWDHRLPLSDTARMVLTYYILCGLLDQDGHGHIRGEIHPKQETVAKALGLSRRSVYTANKALEALRIIRVAHPKPIVTAGGQYVRGPARILYLPVRQLTREEAKAERERYTTALRKIRDTRAASAAEDVHRALLEAWEGQEHCLRAFWNELSRRLHAAGIERATIAALVPSPPE